MDCYPFININLNVKRIQTFGSMNFRDRNIKLLKKIYTVSKGNKKNLS